MMIYLTRHTMAGSACIGGHRPSPLQGTHKGCPYIGGNPPSPPQGTHKGCPPMQADPNSPLPGPGETFTPTSVQEAAQGLRALGNAGLRAQIGAVHAGQQKYVQISTSGLSGIKTYAPDDLYITVGAGTKLVDIQSFLAEHGKQLALASPWPATTIGGLVAANVNAPQRMLYGALRDMVLYTT